MLKFAFKRRKPSRLRRVLQFVAAFAGGVFVGTVAADRISGTPREA